jgi:PAS domain S-box-containing protein
MTTQNAARFPDADATPQADAPDVPTRVGDILPRLLPELEALCREITQRSTADALPAGSEESPIGVALATLEGRFIEVNEALVALSGYTPAELVGRTGPEVGLWTNPDEMLRCIRQRGSVDEYVLPYRTRDGRTRRMLLAARLLNVGGRGCILAVGVDVTERPGFDYEATL